MSSAINIFLTQSVREQAIPFEIHENKPNKKLLKALKETEKMQKHPEKYKGYTNVDELFEDLLKQEFYMYEIKYLSNFKNKLKLMCYNN